MYKCVSIILNTVHKSKFLFTIIFSALLFGCGFEGTKYTVTFDANGGKFKDGSTVKHMPLYSRSGNASECPDEFTFYLPCGNHPKREGYFFLDWKSNQDGTGFSYPGRYNLSSANYKFYAHWGSESEGYIISFDSDGGPPVQDIISVIPNTEVAIPNAADMVREGYGFWGWRDKFSTSYRPSLYANSFELTHYPVQTVTLSAVWQLKKTDDNICTVKFELYGGTLDNSSFSEKQIICGDTVQLPYAFHDNFSFSFKT